ncbi:Co-chaperone Hsc20 [Trichodelitschia bisporula]|uniref:Co-chaperone Hsc20 n=1 Tax=Trichodelitschia bisporula TaxID=703511 RepID=A0A6G1HXB3_9PEZI|nr:Co-chaperone Hsc20 [Trichodelitschia bisporula]
MRPLLRAPALVRHIRSAPLPAVQARRWRASQAAPASTSSAQHQRQTPPPPSSRPQPETPSAPQPPPPSTPQTYYTLFPLTFPHGPPPAGPFTPPLSTLKREYLRLQSSAHPDLHHGQATQASATVSSALINTAYKTLAHPLHRAEYLLSLRGAEPLAEAAKMGDAEGDAELLMEVMEVREAVEGARSEDEVRGLMGENEERIKECVQGLEETFGRDDLEAAARGVVRLRYWVGVEDKLKEWVGEGER